MDTGNIVFHENVDKGVYDTCRLTAEVPWIESDGSTDTGSQPYIVHNEDG